jgi:uncharacterized protein (DUF488 family)
MTEATTNPTAVIYTVGHGRHAWTDFLALLNRYEVEVLCDVRSAARSRWPQFNGQVLAAGLKQAGIGYEWLPECGGKVVAPTEELNRGLERIMELAADSRVALMCSESRPLTPHREPRANCHRVGLLGPPLRARGARLIHILPDGDALEFDESSVPSVW